MTNNVKFNIENGKLISVENAVGDIVIPDTVTEIGFGALSDCSEMTSVIVPASVKKIRPWAFANCKSLTDVSMPKSAVWIEYDTTFYGCVIKSFSWS